MAYATPGNFVFLAVCSPPSFVQFSVDLADVLKEIGYAATAS